MIYANPIAGWTCDAQTYEMNHWGLNVLRSLRARKGWTIEDLAHEMGMSVRWAASQEKKAAFDAKPKMHPNISHKLAKVLDVSLPILMGVTRETLLSKEVPSPEWSAGFSMWFASLTPAHQQTVRREVHGLVSRITALIEEEAKDDLAFEGEVENLRGKGRGKGRGAA